MYELSANETGCAWQSGLPNATMANMNVLSEIIGIINVFKICQMLYYNSIITEISVLKTTIAILMCENKDFIMNIGITRIHKKHGENVYNYKHSVLMQYCLLWHQMFGKTYCFESPLSLCHFQ